MDKLIHFSRLLYPAAAVGINSQCRQSLNASGKRCATVPRRRPCKVLDWFQLYRHLRRRRKEMFFLLFQPLVLFIQVNSDRHIQEAFFKHHRGMNVELRFQIVLGGSGVGIRHKQLLADQPCTGINFQPEHPKIQISTSFRQPAQRLHIHTLRPAINEQRAPRHEGVIEV